VISRDEAILAVKQNLTNQNLQKHVYAVEAVMREMAQHFGEDSERWAMAGLLHDIDYERTKGDRSVHSIESGKMVEEMGFDPEISQAVKAHNEYHGFPRESRMSKVLYSADPLTGLIVAAALISPQKKLSAIDTDFVIKRFGEKAFAKGANREIIKACSDFGMELDEFVTIGIRAMQSVSEALGL